MCLTTPTTPTYNLKIVGVYEEEEEIDVYEHKLEVSGSRLYSVKTRMNPMAFLYVAKERAERETLPIVKDCGHGFAPIVEEHIDMSEYIIITKRTPLYVWYNYYFQDQPIVIGAKERIRIVKLNQGKKDIPKTVKCSPFDENDMRLGAIDGDKLVKGENIHLWNGLVRHQNVFDYHRNSTAKEIFSPEEKEEDCECGGDCETCDVCGDPYKCAYCGLCACSTNSCE